MKLSVWSYIKVFIAIFFSIVNVADPNIIIEVQIRMNKDPFSVNVIHQSIPSQRGGSVATYQCNCHTTVYYTLYVNMLSSYDIPFIALPQKMIVGRQCFIYFLTKVIPIQVSSLRPEEDLSVKPSRECVCAQNPYIRYSYH